jgi:hypothetical protein
MFYLFITLFLLGIITTLFFINKKSKKLKTPTEIKFDLSICNGGGYYIVFINTNVPVPEDVEAKIFIKTSISVAPSFVGSFIIPSGSSTVYGNSSSINGRFEYAYISSLSSPSNDTYLYNIGPTQTREFSGPCF